MEPVSGLSVDGSKISNSNSNEHQFVLSVSTQAEWKLMEIQNV